jgi:predicted thioredoxin/glutaredoxin
MSGKITAQVLADTIRSYLEPVIQSLITIQTSITGPNGRLDRSDQQMKDLESRLTSQFTEKITMLEKKVASLESKASDPSMAVAKELSLQEEKKSNIILFRLPEATFDEDKSMVSAILQSIDASSTTFNCYRVLAPQPLQHEVGPTCLVDRLWFDSSLNLRKSRP